MDDKDILILKLDALSEAIKASTKMSMQVLNEVKSMNNVVSIHITHQEKENERIWNELESTKESRKKIYERLEQLERGKINDGIDPSSINHQIESWASGKIAKGILWAATIVGTAFLTYWAKVLFMQ